MAIQLRGKSGYLAEVNSSNELEVTLDTDADNAGYAALASETSTAADPAGRTVIPVEATRDSRLRVGIDQPIWQLTNEGVQGAFHMFYSDSSIMGNPGNGSVGYIDLNGTSSVLSNGYVIMTSWRTFPVFDSFPTYIEFRLRADNATAAGATIDFGWGTAAATAAPTDGAFFRFSTLGEFRCVVSNNGTETTSSALTAPTGGVYHNYVISLYNNRVDFWVDDTLYATIPVTSSLPQVTMASSAPAFARVYNGTSPAAAAKTVRVALIAASFGDQATNKPWSHVMAGGMNAAYNKPLTQITGQTTNYVNSAAPSAAGTWSNTSAAYTTLGGQWVSPSTWPTAGETDLIVFQYSNLAPAVGTFTGRNLYITGVRIGETYVTGALTGGPGLFQWFISGMGSATSLATADSATAVSHRRIAIGTQALAATAAAGTLAGGLYLDLSGGPILAAPGQRITIGVKILGTSITVGTVRGTVALIGYFE